MAARTLKEIAQLVSGTVVGDDGLIVDHPATLIDAGDGALTFFAVPRHLPQMAEKYSEQLAATKATAAIVSRDVAEAPCALIQVDNPDLAFGQAVAALVPPVPRPAMGAHPSAVVADSAELGEGVAIGANAVIGEGVKIGHGSVVYSNVVIGDFTEIGEGCILYPGVVVYYRVKIGNRVSLHANSVVGSDGFGYAWDGNGHRKIPQVGTVVIADDVEIGACSVIDRARFGSTVIGPGTKLDNLIQIAHNVQLGAHCAFAAQVGISGSTKVGNGVLMGGQVGVGGHLEIGDGAIFSGKSGVTKNLSGGQHYTGNPARPHKNQLDEWRNIKALARLRATVRELEKKIDNLEKEIGRQTGDDE